MKTRISGMVVVLAFLGMAFTYWLGYYQGYHQSDGYVRNVSRLKNVGLAFKSHERNNLSSFNNLSWVPTNGDVTTTTGRAQAK